MHAGTSADDPEDAFAAVSLRFMTPHPVCEKAISAAFNSLFPMITRRIYHSEPRGGGGGRLVSVCVWTAECECERVSSLLSWWRQESLEGNIFLCRRAETRRDSFYLFYYHRLSSTAAVYVTQEENILLPPLHLYHEHGRRAVNSGILTVGVSKISV